MKQREGAESGVQVGAKGAEMSVEKKRMLGPPSPASGEGHVPLSVTRWSLRLWACRKGLWTISGGEWQATDKYTITVHQKTEERDRRVGQLGAPLNQRTPPWLGEKGSPHRPRALAG